MMAEVLSVDPFFKAIWQSLGARPSKGSVAR